MSRRRQARISIAALAALAVLAACSPRTSGSPTADTLAAAASAASATESSLTCFVRGTSLEDARNRPSPLGELRFAFGEDEALLCYGRPSAKGRVVMGELVPFGSPWRLGANEATALHLTFAGDIGGVAVEPGSYSIYAVPAEGEWEFFVNRQVERWGIPINDAVRADDIGSFRRPVSTTASPVEQLTFTWQPHGESMGHLVMEWENTRVEIPVHRASSGSDGDSAS